MGTCAIDGCEKPVTARGWCYTHWRRWRNHGDPLANFRLRRHPCSIEGCDKLARARGWCDKHYVRWRKYGSPHIVHERRAGRGPEKPNWTGDDVNYNAMHKRLRNTRGSAREYACVGCGGPARDWAYDHTDPDERHDTNSGYPVTFSTDMSKYQPMCKSCHTFFDRGRRAA